MKIINRHVLFSSNTPFVSCPAFAALAVFGQSRDSRATDDTLCIYLKDFLSQNILKRLGQDGSRGWNIYFFFYTQESITITTNTACHSLHEHTPKKLCAHPFYSHLARTIGIKWMSAESLNYLLDNYLLDNWVDKAWSIHYFNCNRNNNNFYHFPKPKRNPLFWHVVIGYTSELNWWY